MLIVTCPICGTRNATEFHYGGEYRPRPSVTENEGWTDYLYMKHNRAERQIEWWFHRSGCGLWFLAERHMKSNQVVATYRWQPDANTSLEQSHEP